MPSNPVDAQTHVPFFSLHVLPSISAQGRGIGAALLKDALLRAYKLSNEVGFAALLVHCANDHAREFYLSQSSHFVPCPGAENHLMLPLRALREFIDAL